ncbi:glycoside hydrolase family 19 protein [Cystobacter fuscus]
MILLFPLGAAAVAGGAVLAGYTARQKARDAVLSLQQLLYVVPNLPAARARQLLPHLIRAAREFNLTEPRVLAAFLGQVAFESDSFRKFEEVASGAAYEGRANLGNTQPGDGVRFKGRGAIQLTGRANYTAAAKALGVDRWPTPSSRPPTPWPSAPPATTGTLTTCPPTRCAVRTRTSGKSPSACRARTRATPSAPCSGAARSPRWG